MNHDGGAAIGENAVWRGWIEREVVDLEGGLTEVAFADDYVLGQVAGMVPHRIQGAVLLAFGVEVASRGFEIGRVTERFGVDVDGMLADGQILEVQLDDELALSLNEGSRTSVFSGAGFEGNDENVLWFGEDWNGEE